MIDGIRIDQEKGFPHNFRYMTNVLFPISGKRGDMRIYITFLFNHLGDTFVQSDLKMRIAIEAIKPTLWQVQYASAETSPSWSSIVYALFTAAPSLIFYENESEAVRDRLASLQWAVLLFNVFSDCSAH